MGNIKIGFKDIEQHLIEQRGLRNSMVEFLMLVNGCTKERANLEYETFVWNYLKKKKSV